MDHVSSDLFCVTSFSHNKYVEYFVHTTIYQPEEIPSVVDETISFLENTRSSAINIRIFTDEESACQFQAEHSEFIADLACPITWISQKPEDGSFTLSIQIHAVSFLHVSPLVVQGNRVGCLFQDEDLQYVILSLLPEDMTAAKFDQTYQIFSGMQNALRADNMDFSNTVRTWLFAEDILSWYDQLNKARDKFFNENDVFNQLVPASTGVGVANPAGAAMTAELIGMKPLNENVSIEAVNSPLQCPALDYKSSFSRAVCVRTPGQSRLYISGTASIAPDGLSAHLDDTPKQIELTMQVIEAILKEVAMDWSHVVRGIAYMKHQKDIPLFEQYCRSNGLSIPHVMVHADVCRDDLLFELEVEALKNG